MLTRLVCCENGLIMLCCAAHGEAGSITSCLANRRHNNGRFTARRHAPISGRDNGKGFGGRALKWAIKCLAESKLCFVEHIHTHSTYTQNNKTLIPGLWRAKGHTVTHTVWSVTQASLGIWRAEGSCQTRVRRVPADTSCRSCWKRARAHPRVTKGYGPSHSITWAGNAKDIHTLIRCHWVLWIKHCFEKSKYCGNKNVTQFSSKS